MRNRIIMLALSITVCHIMSAQSGDAAARCQQKLDELTSQRDSLEALYNGTLYYLDSITGLNIRLKEQVNSQKAELSKSKKQVSDQNAKIQKLEGEVKQLSTAAKKKTNG